MRSLSEATSPGDSIESSTSRPMIDMQSAGESCGSVVRRTPLADDTTPTQPNRVRNTSWNLSICEPPTGTDSASPYPLGGADGDESSKRP